jgi:putative DNA primase/helicase
VIASLREIAHALGGDVAGAQVLAPGPAHDQRDRSLSVKISASSPDGFLCHSFAGDDFKDCRDYVKSRLGMRQFEPAQRQPKAQNPRIDDKMGRIHRGREMWLAALEPRGTIAEAYLNSRGLHLGADIAGAVLRFHPRCPWKEGEDKPTIFVPAMIAAVRSIASDEITAVQRTRLTPDGQKVARRTSGVWSGAAVKFDPDDTVSHGLHIGEGAETCMSARQLGLKPTWALGSKGQIAKFAVLGGIETLTILAEPDAEAEVRECAERWHKAGREVLIVRPIGGKDLNDALRGAA